MAINTCNFDLRYVEIALSMQKEIKEDDFHHIIELIGYLQCVDEYSLRFPDLLEFVLPDGQIDLDYESLREFLIAEGLFAEVKHHRYIFLTSKGRRFFKQLEKKCLEVETTFSQYALARCN